MSGSGGPDELFAAGHYMAAARGFEADGRTIQAAEAYGAAGVWDRAGALLAEARRFREAGMAFLRMLPGEPTPANLLSQEQSRGVRQAANCFERCAQIPLAAALLAGIGEYKRAAALLRKAGRRTDAQQVGRGRPVQGSPWPPGFVSSAPAQAARAATGVAPMPGQLPDGWVLQGPDAAPTGVAPQPRGPAPSTGFAPRPRGPALNTGYARQPEINPHPPTAQLGSPDLPPLPPTAAPGGGQRPPELPPLPHSGILRGQGSPEPVSSGGFLGDPEADPFIGFGEAPADPFFGAEPADSFRSEDPAGLLRSGVDDDTADVPLPATPVASAPPISGNAPEGARPPLSGGPRRRRRHQPLDEAVTTRSVEMGLGPLGTGSIIDDRFEVLGPLGEGGFAIVFRVLDKSLEEEVALKLFKPEANDARGIERFKREIRMARQLAHPNIVRTWEYGEWRHAHYMTMEMLDGLDLHSYNEEIHWARMPVWLACDLTAQALDGLGHAHETQVVHRDIKLRNLFVCKGRGFLPDAGPTTRAPRLKVMDFGIAAGGGFSAGLTRTGMVVGTPTFVPPERLRPNAGDAQPTVDIYAMGVVLYRLLTGKLPYSSRNIATLLKKILTEPPTPPSAVDPEIPRDVEDFVLALMARKPQDRPQDAFDAADELRSLRRAHRDDPR